MNSIINFFKIDWSTFIISIFAAGFALKEILSIISYFKTRYRVKTGVELDKETIELRINKLEQHDKWQYEEITKISLGVENIGNQLTSMQKKMDETEMAKLKDTLISYYKKYKDVGEWNTLEKDAFWDLFKSYESHGGNGFLHEIVEPIMRELDVID